MYECSADGKYEVSYKPNVVIFSHGEVLWIPPAIYKSSCTIDVQYFPFDQQQCQMKFGSWTFNGDQVSPCILCSNVDSVIAAVSVLTFTTPKVFNLVTAARQRCFYRCSLDLLSLVSFRRLISEVAWPIVTKLCNVFDGDPDL